jgi:hypothetical protein
MLDYIALGVLVFIILLIAAAIVFIGSIPGKIAKRRGHPWPDAVNAASWIGLATGVLWPAAFVWAFLPVPQRAEEKSSGAGDASAETAGLRERVAALEATIERMQSQIKEGAS